MCAIAGPRFRVRLLYAQFMAPHLEFPGYKQLARIAIDFCRLTPKNEHFKAVQLVCSSAMEHYRGILKLIEAEDALSAKVVSRVLLEVLVTAVVLAKHPEKIEDFRECGRYFHLRRLQYSTWLTEPRLAKERDSPASKHGADYKHLEKKYGTRLWHGLTRKASFIEAGFDFDVYDIFYRPTSEMTHAEPSRYVMRDPDDAWVFGRSDLKELRYLAGAYVSSYELLLVGMEQINRVLSLPFGNRLAACKKSLFGFAPKYEEALLSVKDGEGGPILRGLKIPTKP